MAGIAEPNALSRRCSVKAHFVPLQAGRRAAARLHLPGECHEFRFIVSLEDAHQLDVTMFTISDEELFRATSYGNTSRSGFSNGLSCGRVLDLVPGPSGGDLSIGDELSEGEAAA